MSPVEAVFINLDRDVERRAAMEKQLSEIRLPYPVERFAGIDGSLQRGRPENLRPGQYGCWLSHAAALERSLPNGRHLHVMEDDVLLSRKFAAVLGALRALSGSGESWDLLYLDATLLEIQDMHQVFEWVKQSRQAGVVQVCKVPAQFTVYGMLSYIVNSSRKKHLRDFLHSHLDEGRPIDNVIASGIQKGELKAYLTVPFLSSGSDGSVVSTIGYEGGDEVFLPSLLFRRLCFHDLGEEAAAALAARAAELTRDVARPDAIFGALCGYRVEKWPNTYFPPGHLAPSGEAPPAAAGGEVEISAVMPCLNEARTIGICVEKAKRAFARLGMAGEVVVADNGSTDGSAELARAAGARVVSQSVKGYGAALQAGIEAAQGRLIVMADADDSYDWSAIEPLVLKLQEGYDLVVGNRFRGGIQPGAMPWLHRYVGNPVLSGFTRLAFGVAVGDVHCGMRAFTKSAFERMRTATLGMEFATEMIANAAHNGLRITEVPTRLYPDKRGRPPHLRSFRDGWRHLRFILTYAPDYLYLAPGAALLAAGLLLQALLVAGPVELGGTSLGIHYLALGAMLSLVGFNVINLGVLAKAVMGQRYDNLRSRTIRLIRRSFSLEGGLVTGALLMLAGLSVDGVILAIRLANPGEAMEGTVHPAFVATTMVVLGLNLLFSSFLLAMVMASRRGDG